MNRTEYAEKRTFEPFHEILVLIVHISNEGSGEPAHMRRLAKVFDARKHGTPTLRALSQQGAFVSIRDKYQNRILA